MPKRRNPNTIFTKIIAGQIPADIVYQDDRVTAFRDINPQAPVHILIIPNEPIPDLSALEQDEAELIGHMVQVANRIARDEGLIDPQGPVTGKGYRLVVNTGEGVGQSVPHLHMHLLGGRLFGWPPG